jgi:hypothetical protein
VIHLIDQCLHVQTENGHRVIYDRIDGEHEIPDEVLPFQRNAPEHCFEYCMSMGYYGWVTEDSSLLCISSTNKKVETVVTNSPSLILNVEDKTITSSGRRIKGCGNNFTDITVVKKLATAFEVSDV